jgi:hypothetical protein
MGFPNFPEQGFNRVLAGYSVDVVAWGTAGGIVLQTEHGRGVVMKPTNELRWVLRKPYGSGLTQHGAHHVLQQKWIKPEYDIITGNPVCEWRDVPVEEE